MLSSQNQYQPHHQNGNYMNNNANMQQPPMSFEDPGFQSSQSFQSPSQMAAIGANNGTNPNAAVINPYAAEYLNTVKENRSAYGSYVDNTLTYDPHKEQKSHFNVIYDTDQYNPWGKPGGGAPKLDNNTGNVRTKIVGTLKWNLNGETEEDRMKRLQTNGNRLMSPTKTTPLMYRKAPVQNSPMSQTSPRRSVVTTYNYNFRDPYLNNQQPPPMQKPYQPTPPQQPYSSSTSMNDLSSMQMLNPSMQQQPFQQTQNYPQSQPQIAPFQYPSQSTNNNQNLLPPIQPFETQIERDAQIRNFERMTNVNDGNNNNSNNSNNNLVAKSWTSNNGQQRGGKELNRMSNKLFTDNQPSMHNPNTPFWFGRTGTYNSSSVGSFNNSSSSMYTDVRRRKLLDQLENRQPLNNKYATSMSNEYLPSIQNQQYPNNSSGQYTFVNSSVSNHRNRYENPVPMN